MKKLVLYHKTPYKLRDFRGVERVTVPNQALSLRDIIKRFVRREPLPNTSVEGVYEDRFGDLEKLTKADPVVQQEFAVDLGKKLDAIDKREREKISKAKAKAEADARAVEPAPAKGVKPDQNPPTGGASPP